jgi:hypothetical protein
MKLNKSQKEAANNEAERSNEISNLGTMDDFVEPPQMMQLDMNTPFFLDQTPTMNCLANSLDCQDIGPSVEELQPFTSIPEIRLVIHYLIFE